MLALAAQHNLHLEQLDVKSAFLHANIEKDVLIKQPEGFENIAEDGTKLVCKLKKTINGLKQAGKNWYDRLKNFPRNQNFPQSKNEYFFVKRRDSSLIYVLGWVNDIVFASSDLEQKKIPCNSQ